MLDQEKIKYGKALKKKELFEEWMIYRERANEYSERIYELEHHICKLRHIIRYYKEGIATIYNVTYLPGSGKDLNLAIKCIIDLIFPDHYSEEKRQELFDKEYKTI